MGLAWHVPLFSLTGPDSLGGCSVPVSYRGALGTEHILGVPLSGNLRRTVSVGAQRNTVDDSISSALIEKQVETLWLVAQHLHRNGLSVYIREGVDGGLRRFVDTTD